MPGLDLKARFIDLLHFSPAAVQILKPKIQRASAKNARSVVC